MKTITILTALMTFSFGLPTAQAGLLGMPLQLKSVIQHIENGAPGGVGNASRGTDDGLTDPFLTISC
jgi:hypothetical protein